MTLSAALFYAALATQPVALPPFSLAGRATLITTAPVKEAPK